MEGKLDSAEAQRTYILAGSTDAGGNGHAGAFTLRSVATGQRFTFRAKPPSGRPGGPCRRCDGTGKWRGLDRYPCRACEGTGVSPATSHPPLFVGVLTGSENTSDYQYLGQITRSESGDVYQHGRKSRIGEDALSAKAARWYLTRLLAGQPTPGVEVYHDGHCGRCGRLLTVPESVATGIGPECAERMAAGK
jgi:hypothetical protein